MRIDSYRYLHMGVECGHVYRGFRAERKARKTYPVAIHLGQAAQVFDLACDIVHHLTHAEPVDLRQKLSSEVRFSRPEAHRDSVPRGHTAAGGHRRTRAFRTAGS